MISLLLEDEDEKKDANTIRNDALMKILQLLLAHGGGNTNNDTGDVHKVQCAACGTNPITSDRYKCLMCEDIDMCAHCFERRRESTEHKSGHAFVHFKSPGELFGQPVRNSDVTFAKLKKLYAREVHENITCDGCGSDTIRGLRFKCDTCANYDLCEQCVNNEITTKTHKSTHPLIVIPVRAILQIPVEDIQLGDELGSGAFGTYPIVDISYHVI